MMFSTREAAFKPHHLAASGLWLCAVICHAGEVRYDHGVKIIYAQGTAPAVEGSERTPAPQPKIYKFKVGGTTTFSDMAPARGNFVLLDFSCYACNPSSPVDWQATRLHRTEFSEAIEPAARRFGVDPALVRAVIHAESGFNAQARSPKGAMGLMQLMPATAREVGVSDAYSPAQNIRGGVQYLAGLLAQFRNNVTLAAAAYNAGPAAVEKYSGVPPYAETQAYVKRVNLLHQRYRAQGRD